MFFNALFILKPCANQPIYIPNKDLYFTIQILISLTLYCGRFMYNKYTSIILIMSKI